MNRLKVILLLVVISSLGACVDSHRLKPNEVSPPLGDDEAYLSLVIDTLDNLRSLQLLYLDTGKTFYIGNAKQGVSQITLRVASGEYCFIGFSYRDFIFDYTENRHCTYAEAGELNYFGEFEMRHPVTNVGSNFSRFPPLLGKDHPELCQEYIGEGC